MLQATLSEPLEEGRAKWVLEKGGKRFKLQTIDDNEVIIVIFIYSRGRLIGSLWAMEKVIPIAE